MKSKFLASVAIATMAMMSGTSAFSQEYPSRPIRLVVPLAAAGGGDLAARSIADPLERKLGQPIIVENKPGAGTSIGTDIVAKAKPDGYTLLLVPGDFAAIDKAYGNPVPYDAKKDFTYIAGVSAIPFVLVASPKSGITSLQDLIAKAKASPDELTFASLGTSSSHFLFFENFKARAGIKIRDIPYKSSSQAATDTIGGQVHLTLTSEGRAAAHQKSGQMVPIASTAPKRGGDILPNLPTFAEIFPDLVHMNWFALAGPANMPDALVQKLSADVADALRLPDTERRLGTMGMYPWILSPAKLDAHLDKSIGTAKDVIQKSGAKPEGR